MKYLSVCSGIEAATVAWHPLGWSAIAFSEIEKFPCAVLAHHYPDVPNLGDMTEMDVEPLGQIDILVGGTPCQAFSVAGLRQSLDDARGNLTLSYVRLIHELVADHGLRNAVWENVPGVLSTKDNAFGCFLGAIVGSDDPLLPPGGKRWPNAGMVSGPKGRAAWAIKDAQYFGLAQRRRRVFVVSDFGRGADPAAVLFELEGVRGNPAPSREAREDVTHPIAPSLTSSGRGVEQGGDTRGQDPVVAMHVPSISAALETTSHDYSLRAGGHDGSHANAGVPPAIAFNHNAQAAQLPSASRDTSVNDGLTRSQQAAAAIGSAVRRLTPVECERLQGFPDSYTKISDKTADGPRYKALGNSMAVPVMRWIGERIDRFMPRDEVPAPKPRARFNFGKIV